ncbi:TPA: hypothetical protein NG682_004736 [Vibrio parahaemolyticus]|uniref:hypothetical protein n=1 Tax=Vibrio parahaemolyticus TaxID=670 RepID=UPI001120D40C|nr:hypothetical protein [Vibrio parahaemolyticus]MDF4941831.1 hypothetical protein [Vibrio parahaemolyticus]TOK32060.1 hypothetical protein CGI20_25265 [Vibrio parahaemolyticus]HCE3705941.1 hypothetical protein [Vibrio parahaemolyticus]HCG6654645.1 hypothetical protein [Vibrio parahaemolyticus]
MSYLQELNEAIERSKRLGIADKTFTPTTNRYYSDDRLENLIGTLSHKYGGLRPSHLIGKCLQVHFDILNDVKDVFGAEPLFTLGYIYSGEQYFFQFDENDVTTWLNENIDKNNVKIHAWITLPSLEIIDLTFPLTYAKVAGLEESPIAITKHADEFTGGMKYHPVIVGEEALFKLGVVEALTICV